MIPNEYIPASANLYDCRLTCDNTRLTFSGLDQTEVLRLLQLLNKAIWERPYRDNSPVYMEVSAMPKETQDVPLTGE